MAVLSGIVHFITTYIFNQPFILLSLVAMEMCIRDRGTNDLCQYLFAADRTNKNVAPYAQKYAPVLLGLLGQMAAAFDAAGKPLSICGELGGDALATAALVGLCLLYTSRCV